MNRMLNYEVSRYGKLGTNCGCLCINEIFKYAEGRRKCLICVISNLQNIQN